MNTTEKLPVTEPSLVSPKDYLIGPPTEEKARFYVFGNDEELTPVNTVNLQNLLYSLPDKVDAARFTGLSAQPWLTHKGGETWSTTIAGFELTLMRAHIHYPEHYAADIRYRSGQVPLFFTLQKNGGLQDIPRSTPPESAQYLFIEHLAKEIETVLATLMYLRAALRENELPF